MKNNRISKLIICTLLSSTIIFSLSSCSETGGENSDNSELPSFSASSSSSSSSKDISDTSSEISSEKSDISKTSEISEKSENSENSKITSSESSGENVSKNPENENSKNSELPENSVEKIPENSKTENTNENYENSEISETEIINEHSENNTSSYVVKPEISNTSSPSNNSDISDISENSEEIIPAACPKEWIDNGIFQDYYSKAYAIVSQMSIEEKVGQMLLARCPVYDFTETAKQYHLGGYVLFGANTEYKTKEQLKNEIQSAVNSQDIPMIISVDEEGGTVVRISSNSNLRNSAFLSPRSLFSLGGMEAINNDAKEKADLLSSLSINSNLAPVCDLTNDPSDFMYYRSLGQSPEITGEYIASVTKISQENGVSVCLKHFPGYGNNVDTHTGIAIDDRTIENFRKNDFIPFKYGIDAKAHMILVSHNIVNCIDSERPASISPKVHEVLRNELGFTGIIVTDDMAMDAINLYSGKYKPAVSAVIAGNDMIIVSDIDGAYNDILSAVKDGIVDEETLDHAAMRVIAWKCAKEMIK